MNHILVGPWNQRAWAGRDKSRAWTWVYHIGHICVIVLSLAHLSGEWDSKIQSGHRQHDMMLDINCGMDWKVGRCSL